MKGTIDQVEAFFCSITGVWVRLAVFLGALVAGHTLGLVAAKTCWESSDGLSWKGLGFGEGEWPFSLGMTILNGCTEPVGAAYVAAILLLLFFHFFSEWSLFRLTCLLVLAECWHSFFVLGPSIEDMLVGTGSTIQQWHPLVPFMVVLSAFVLWRTIASWRNDHRSVMPA